MNSNRTRSLVACENASASIGFVGIGKTGSIFVAGALELFAHEQLLTTTHSKEASMPCAVGARFGWHHASAFLWHRAFGTAWTNAFTFSLVRNPWTRLVSHWAFHLVSRSPLDVGVLNLTQERRLALKMNETLSIEHFRAWARHVHRVHPPHSSEAWRFTTADAHGNEQARGFNASQISWLVDGSGALLVDTVYKLEELRGRWPELQASWSTTARHRPHLSHRCIPWSAIDCHRPPLSAIFPWSANHHHDLPLGHATGDGVRAARRALRTRARRAGDRRSRPPLEAQGCRRVLRRRDVGDRRRVHGGGRGGLWLPAATKAAILGAGE